MFSLEEHFEDEQNLHIGVKKYLGGGMLIRNNAHAHEAPGSILGAAKTKLNKRKTEAIAYFKNGGNRAGEASQDTSFFHVCVDTHMYR